jgi:hypothetical protein
MPHDYAQGTDVFIHVHWGHNGTAIAGNFTVQLYATWCKGFNQAGNIFEAEAVTSVTDAVTSVTTHPRWGHFITEVQLSNATGDASHLHNTDMEVDGLFLVSAKVTSIPTITGSATSNLPYIFTIDIHYQSTNIGTKQKAPPFWT